GHAVRIVNVFVHGAFDLRLLQRACQALLIRTTAEGQQVHEQAVVRALGLAVLQAASLAEIRRVDARASSFHALTLSAAGYNYSEMTTDSRQAAQGRLADLLTLLRADTAHAGQLKPLIEEAEALGRAIGAFHLEGIRFRIYNVDRQVSRPPVPLPGE